MRFGFLCVAIGLVLNSCTSTQDLPQRNEEFASSPLYFLKSEEAVVQDYDVSLSVHSLDKATYTVRKVVTVLNSDARNAGLLVLPYDEFHEITDFQGAIYDAQGNLVRSIDMGQGDDFSMSEGVTLYQDTRIRSYEMYHNIYPYTVVYEFEMKLDGLLNLPDFYPQKGNQYVEDARFTVRLPQDLRIKYRTQNSDVTVNKGIFAQDSVFIWRFENISPKDPKPFGKSMAEKLPKVLLALNDFEIAGTRGTLSSWDSFGQWYYELSEGRQELPEHTREEIKTIFANAPNRREGIKALYKYMQDKTRYVSIQLGIGGWQPFEASFVEEKGYGDCKALTNYMQAILAYAGVQSYPVLIKNGIAEPDIATDFPSNQFNHVVLWVPEADTIWLESTSQTIPFDYIGYSNANRHGLAVTPDSSFLVKTPAYGSETNKLQHKAELKLDPQGNVSMDIHSSYSGYYLDNVLGDIAKKSSLDREKWIHNHYSLNSFKVTSADFSGVDQKEKEPVLHVQIENPRYATRTESRIFVPVNKLNRWEGNLPDLQEERVEDINLGYSFWEQDQSRITIPPDFSVEALPDPIELNTDFGTFRVRINSTENNAIEIHRVLELRKHNFSADRYNDIKEFFARIIEYDKKNIVLVES